MYVYSIMFDLLNNLKTISKTTFLKMLIFGFIENYEYLTLR